MIGLPQNGSRSARILQASRVLSVIGWVVMAASGFMAVLAYDSMPYNGFAGKRIESVAWVMLLVGRVGCPLMMGIAVIIAAQFVRYAFGGLENPPKLLKHGDKILILYALVGCVPVVGGILFNTAMYRELYPLMVTISWSSLIAITRVALIVALAVALRKILPVIREMKGLV